MPGVFGGLQFFQTVQTVGDVPLLKFMYLVVTCMPGESYHR